MNVCLFIAFVICLADLIAEIIEWIYSKVHDWDNDIGYQMWKTYNKGKHSLK